MERDILEAYAKSMTLGKEYPKPVIEAYDAALECTTEDGRSNHYGKNAIQPIDYTRANCEHLEPFAAICFHNIVKYITRQKGSQRQDLMKAQDYLRWWLESLKD